MKISTRKAKQSWFADKCCYLRQPGSLCLREDTDNTSEVVYTSTKGEFVSDVIRTRDRYPRLRTKQVFCATTINRLEDNGSQIPSSVIRGGRWQRIEKRPGKQGLGRSGDGHADSWLGQEFCLLWGRMWPERVTRGDHRIKEMAPIHGRLEAASAWSCDLNRDTGLGDCGCSPHPTPKVWKVRGMGTKGQSRWSSQSYPLMLGNYSS